MVLLAASSAFFGGQFQASGWDVQAAGLAAGNYRLVAAARSAVAGAFSSQHVDISVQQPTPHPAMALDAPRPDSVIGTSFVVTGWAADAGAPAGTGVDAVHVWAHPMEGTGSATPVLLGAAVLGIPRPDVAAVLGPAFTPSGFSLEAALPAGTYVLVAYARSTITRSFNQSARAKVTVTAAASSEPAMAIDGPSSGSTQSQPFLISGWAVDLGAPADSGVDSVHVWAFPVSDGGRGGPLFLGVASYGATRSDVSAFFGARFGASGYSLSVSGLTPGTYDLVVYASSTVAGTFNQSRVVRVSVP